MFVLIAGQSPINRDAGFYNRGCWNTHGISWFLNLHLRSAPICFILSNHPTSMPLYHAGHVKTTWNLYATVSLKPKQKQGASSLRRSTKSSNIVRDAKLVAFSVFSAAGSRQQVFLPALPPACAESPHAANVLGAALSNVALLGLDRIGAKDHAESWGNRHAVGSCTDSQNLVAKAKNARSGKPFAQHCQSERSWAQSTRPKYRKLVGSSPAK